MWPSIDPLCVIEIWDREGFSTFASLCLSCWNFSKKKIHVRGSSAEHFSRLCNNRKAWTMVGQRKISVVSRHQMHIVVLFHSSTRPFSTETRKNMDLLWKDYFKDPSLWWDHRDSKTNPRSPDFKHKITKELLWIHGWYNPPWVQEELGKRGLQPLVRSTEVRDGELCEMRNAKGFHYKAPEMQVLIVSSCNDQKFQQDSDVVALLMACAKQKDLSKGSRIHADILKKGLLEKNIYVGNNLVNMYAKCGALAKAQAVFDKLPVRNVFSWNALITGYAQHRHGGEVLNCFERMQRQGLSPNAVTFICILKACGSIAAADKGQQIHAEIVRAGLLEKNIVVGTALVDMYAKCGALAKAQEVFDELPVRDVVSWNALIAGYAQNGHGGEVLNCFERMQCQGLSPNAVTFTCVLKACGSIAAADKGQQIHAEIVRAGLLENNIMVGTALVDMYAKCGALAKAQEVFDQLPVLNVVSWNVLIAGYAQHGHGGEVLNCFERMQCQGLSPDAVTFTCILKACGSIAAADKAQQIHAEIVRAGLLEKNIVVGTALVDMYAKCGALAKAQEVFDKLPVRDVVSWNALIAGYAQHGHGGEVLNCFERMQCEGLSPNAVTFICILKACGCIAAADKGQQIHAEIVRAGLLEKNIVVGTALVDMYAKCGALAKAQEVFDQLPVLNVVSWNALIAGYAQHGHGGEVLNCFEWMQRQGLSPDAVTFTCILKACGSIAAADKGQQIHAEIVRAGLLEKDIVVGTALVDMYAKCGAFAKAQEVFDELPVRDVVSWNALIAGYAQHGHGREVLNCFERMQGQGLSPDAVTFTCILKACGSISAADKGQKIHAEIVRAGLLEKNIVVGTALVDMYAKCGALAKAQEVFDKLPVLNVVTWNALMAGYAQFGQVDIVFNLFNKMVGEGIEPNLLAFLLVLNACSHSGLLDKAQMYFETMSTRYGIIPTVEHHSCMVDLFGRAGHFDKAVAVIEKMPFSANLTVWCALLGACRKWGNVKLGRFAFEHAVQLDEKCAAAYVCMTNIYAAAGMQEDADKIEAMRVKKGAWKKPGHCWWTDVSGIVHSFYVGDNQHSQSKNIYKKLEDIAHKISQEGYSPGLHLVSQDISDDANKDVLCGHSEKFAIACALINT